MPYNVIDFFQNLPNKILNFILFKLYQILILFFKWTDFINEKIKEITSNVKKLEKIKKISNIIFAVTIIVYLIVMFFILKKPKLNISEKLKFILFLTTFTLIIIKINQIINKLEEISNMFRSIRGFFKNVIWLFFSLFLVGLTIVINFVKSDISILIGIMLIACFIWSFISCCADINIAILANLILTGVSGMLFQISNYVFLYKINIKLPDDIKLPPEYTFPEILKIFMNTIFLSITIILGLTTIICALKKHWIEKYRNH